MGCRGFGSLCFGSWGHGRRIGIGLRVNCRGCFEFRVGGMLGHETFQKEGEWEEYTHCLLNGR